MDVDALLANHFDGFVRNWANPDDGEVERGKFGDNGDEDPDGTGGSCGLSVFA